MRRSAALREPDRRVELHSPKGELTLGKFDDYRPELPLGPRRQQGTQRAHHSNSLQNASHCEEYAPALMSRHNG